MTEKTATAAYPPLLLFFYLVSGPLPQMLREWLLVLAQNIPYLPKHHAQFIVRHGIRIAMVWSCSLLRRVHRPLLTPFAAC